MRRLLAHLARIMLGPVCRHGCGYRARGVRTLAGHERRCELVRETYAERLARQGDE